MPKRIKVRAVCTLVELADFLDAMPELIYSHVMNKLTEQGHQSVRAFVDSFKTKQQNDWVFTAGKLAGLISVVSRYEPKERDKTVSALLTFLSCPRERWQYIEVDLAHSRARWMGPEEQRPQELSAEKVFFEMTSLDETGNRVTSGPLV